jgi:hypothetical protein
MNPEQQQEILNLRSLNLTPKQIARKLGLRVAEVTAFIKAQAEQTASTQATTGELAPIAQCLADRNCFQRLLSSDTVTNDDSTDIDGIGGLGLVLVSRTTGYNRFTVCTYLVDYWCLGLKDTMGPKQFNGNKYSEFIETSYTYFPDGYQEISLPQAQAIVFGAIDYAQSLGFSPHHDLAQTRQHLGEPTTEIKLNFGRSGKPFFISGPYENFRQIMDTLEKNVGAGNFDYLIRADG